MRRTTNVKETYFLWLCTLIKNRRFNYWKLARELHNKKFRWSVPNDDNRCGDGLYLRQTFIEQEGLDEDHLEVVGFLKGECTVLEVLVALAQRIDFQTYDLDTQENKTSKWFFEMIGNLGLDKFPDENSRGDRLSELDELRIDEILEGWLDRSYAFDGTGGLFPLKRHNRHKGRMRDQTTVEIWYQMMAYLEERHGRE